jgi:hypothetical protein
MLHYLWEHSPMGSNSDTLHGSDSTANCRLRICLLQAVFTIIQTIHYGPGKNHLIAA